jgi:hypothetical protein
MSDTEKEVMAMYRESAPDENKLFWRSHINHVAWSLLLVVLAFSVWLMIALANAENQRNAYASKKCEDRMFKGETDMQCMKTVRTRDHWWEHVGYALTHTKP